MSIVCNEFRIPRHLCAVLTLYPLIRITRSQHTLTTPEQSALLTALGFLGLHYFQNLFFQSGDTAFFQAGNVGL